MQLRAVFPSLILGSLMACVPERPADTAASQPVATAAATPSAKADPLEQMLDQSPPLALDPRIKKGKLENGLTYYILPNKRPEKRAQLWLAVNAGSVLEDDDQRGLAHFIEHMCFNGTRRFPKGELVDFLEKSGLRFGADLNAYTSFDETVYKMQVPTDKPEFVGRALSMLRDFADGVTFDPKEVEKERGVVLEEWRLRQGAGSRLHDKQETDVKNASRYLTHTPIGKPEIIKSAPRDTLVRYYRDWYRPDLMAVIAVGDFSPADVEAKLKSEFASLKGPAKERPRPVVPAVFSDKTTVNIETDPELPQARVSIIHRFPHRPQKSAKDFRRGLLERLFNTMLNARLDEVRRQPDAPFLSASSATTHPTRPSDVFQQTALVKEDGVQEGLAALYQEVLRVERHGFTASELERAKNATLRTAQLRVAEADKRDSALLIAQLVRNFTQEESMEGSAEELAMVQKFLPTFALDEVDKVGKGLGQGGRLITVSGPASMMTPTRDAVFATLKDVGARTIPAYEDSGPAAPVMTQIPTPGPVVKTANIAEVGVTEWTLRNGVRVVVKPTNFANDSIRVSAFSPGGTSLVSDADFDSARFASAAMAQGGLGQLDAVKLRKSLAGKVVSVTASISELSEAIAASTVTADLELMMQLIHLSFVAPRRDESAFQSWRAREIESFKNRRLSPEATFAEDMAVFASQNHLRRRPANADTFQRVDLDKAYAFYRDRFGDAGDFTFVFVGNVDLERLKPLVETYLGSLPSRGRKENWRDVKAVAPNGVQVKTVLKGSEPKSRVTLTFHGDESWSRDAENDIRTMAEIFRIRLREVLREDMGGVYGVSVSGVISRRPRQEFAVNVSFGCSPDNVDKLVKAIFEEAKTLQDKNVGDDYLTKVREIRRRTHETALKDNAYWLRELERAYVYGDDPRLTLSVDDLVAKMTADRVRAAAKKYLTPKQYLLGVLKPQTTR
jgi:zinc protease